MDKALALGVRDLSTNDPVDEKILLAALKGERLSESTFR
jgi:hypothetical protein